MALALSGIIGYYGRSTVITWKDCQSIEQVKASASTTKGYSVGIPRLQIYDLKERGGMGMEHAYTYAAAALIDQVDRALSAVEGEPARVAVDSSLAHTLRRLGCRSDKPAGVEAELGLGKRALSDELMIEAYLKAKWRWGGDGHDGRMGRESKKGPLRPEAWS